MQTCEQRRRRDREKSNIKAGRHPREVLLTVPNAPLRARYLDLLTTGQSTASEIAYALGWEVRSRGRVAADTERLKRALGLAKSTSTRVVDAGKIVVTYVREEIDYEVAEQLCLAMYADPPAVGV